MLRCIIERGKNIRKGTLRDEDGIPERGDIMEILDDEIGEEVVYAK